MAIDDELRNIKVKKRLTFAVPIFTAAVGGYLGGLTGKLAEHYNDEVENLENNARLMLKDYRLTEKKIETEIENLPGLSWWKSSYEKLFGEAQEVVGVKEENEEFVKLQPEDISLQGFQAPDNYGAYPLLGLTIGFAYGLMKVRNKLSSLKKDEKYLRLIR